MSWGLQRVKTKICCIFSSNLIKMNCTHLAGPSENGPPKLWYRFSMEFRLRPNAVRSCPIANETRFGSLSAALMNVSNPIIPNWLLTIVGGMFVTRPFGSVSTPRFAFSLGIWWRPSALPALPPCWCPSPVSDCIISIQRFEPIEFLLSIILVPSEFITPLSDMWCGWCPPEPMALFDEITDETDADVWCSDELPTLFEFDPTTPARLSLVPGSAGKSSLDIWNSVCSDVGCFTIPTESETIMLVFRLFRNLI